MEVKITNKGTGLFDKRIALFLLSQNISLFGSSVVGFAIIWYITLETSSGLWLMLSTICSMAPHAVISIWGGVWADRYNRKYIIMLADAFIALSTLGLALAFLAGYERLELLLVVSAVRSIGGGIQAPSVNAIFPQLVSQDKLTRVQGINQTLNSVLLLLSPAVGGVVLGSMGIVWAFLLDVITAAIAILIISFIKVQKVERTDAPAPLITEVKQGINYAFQHPLLRGIIICYAFSMVLITPVAVLSPLLVERSFGDEIWKLTANEVIWTVGSLIGGVFVSLLGSFKDKIRTIALCLFAFGVTFGLLGVAKPFWVYLTVMGIAGLFMPILATAQTVFIQEIAQPAMLGRVFSILQIVATTAMPIAILFFGPLADVVPVESILVVTGVLLALVGLIYQRSGRTASAAWTASNSEE
ncbi:MAG: MFS transporter [Chloroflexi bacterium]|nr:MFS transporter [Chloroflexota bacterium]